MKINQSSVSMSSSSSYERFSTLTVISSEMTRKLGDGEEAVTLSISQMAEELRQMLQESRQTLQQNRPAQLQGNQTSPGNVTQSEQTGISPPSKDEMQLSLLKRILESLNKMRKGKFHTLHADLSELKELNRSMRNMPKQQVPVLDLTGQGNSIISGIRPNTSVWTRTTVISAFQSEKEHTAFQTTGTAVTADGREISFNVSFEMSRSFMQMFEYLDIEEVEMILTDPLVINVDAGVASVSDQKFLFDLSGDGTEQSISYLGKGSAFLAYDKNGDGIINDGSELFGTKSGNGFLDLAAYDEDGNGWIDESDSIFEHLKIWYKHDDGTDVLVSLADAGIGAIYLGYVNTPFQLNSAGTNQTNAVIQSTGVYLKETGEAGTIQHVDIAV